MAGLHPSPDPFLAPGFHRLARRARGLEAVRTRSVQGTLARATRRDACVHARSAGPPGQA